jgi:hypothetical protein
MTQPARDSNANVALEHVTKQRAAAQRAARLFAISFLALFLELMLLLWVPAVAKIGAYYANLMLISSFLELGMGAMVARRGWRLFLWFPLSLLVIACYLCSYLVLRRVWARTAVTVLEPVTA